MGYVEHATLLKITQQEIFDFFCDTKNICNITPTWVHLLSLNAPARITKIGDEIECLVKIFGIKSKLKYRVSSFREPQYMRCELTEGPFKLDHQIICEETDAGNLCREAITYSPKGWLLGQILTGLFLRPLLKRWISDRHRLISTAIKEIAPRFKKAA